MDEPNQGQIYTIPKSGRTQPGLNLQVHKVDGSHQGSTRFTKWTNPTRVKLISPQSGRIPPRVNTVHKWTDPTRVKLKVHRVDGPNKGQTYTSPQSGRPSGVTTTFRGMDGPNQFIKLYKSTKWTAIRGHDHIPRNGRTRPGSQTL